MIKFFCILKNRIIFCHHADLSPEYEPQHIIFGEILVIK